MAINYTPSTIGPGISSMEQLNNEFQKISAALDRGLSRYPLDVPNAMQGPLDMGSQDIINVGKITAIDLEVGGIDLASQVQAAQDAADAAQSALAEVVLLEQAVRDTYQNIKYLRVIRVSGDFSITDATTNSMYVVDSTEPVTCVIATTELGAQFMVVQEGPLPVSFTAPGKTILSMNGTNTSAPGAVASVIDIGNDTVYLNGQLV